MNIGESKTYLDGKITVQRRSSDYMAYLTDNKAKWESGTTIEEALGKLVVSLMS